MEVVSVLPRRATKDGTMIIEAIARFACAHRYVAQMACFARPEAGNVDRLLLVCERCGHRAEQLPLQRDTSFGRVIAFPSASGSRRFVPQASNRYPDPPPLLSA
jgi:hypothetical protein